jgi:succinate dehydrogenase/fumarate reductase flavoprotein subunit
MEKKGISRREFLKNTGKVAGGAAVGGLLAGCTTIPSGGGANQKWDLEADVVILGLGGAGASAAIAAYDAGTKDILILEKQPADHHFSNSRMSGGVWHNPDPSGDRASRIRYLRNMMSGELIPWKFEGEMADRSEKMATMFADEMMKTGAWLQSIDPDLDPEGWKPRGIASFPMFPDCVESKYGETISTRYKNYQEANRGDNASLRTYQKPKLVKSSGEALMWALIEEGIKKQRPEIKIKYSTPFSRLITDNAAGTNGEGRVIGAIATENGKEIRVKARKGVVLATGGFEYNVKMRRGFQEGCGVKGWCFYGTTSNEGDGIEAAILAGAALVKVAKSASRLEVGYPYGPTWDEKGLILGASCSATASRNTVIVDNFGVRYSAEDIITDATRPFRYQFYKEVVHYELLRMMYTRTPSWIIFDQARFDASPVTSGGTVNYDYLPWPNNQFALDKGWIYKADTLDALAAKIKADPANRSSMDAEALKATVAKFNQYAKAGKDEEFARVPSTMGPVEKPSFYAMKMFPGGPNTKGGIDADENRQVCRWDGSPIPGLYSAGEISSVFKFVYQAGGNITECMTCGRVAGRNVAAEKAWA